MKRPIPSGSVTLPAEKGEEAMCVELARRWGADAIRDSDGTELSPELLELGLDVYSTICLVRADQVYPRKHLEFLPQKFLMSKPVTATGRTVRIDLLEAYHREKYVVDQRHPPRRYWEVIDRTTGRVVPATRWSFSARTGQVTLRGAEPFHVYTVNFLVYIVWDTTSMYNHQINKWQKPHVIGVDPYHPACWDHLMGFYDRWIKEHARTGVVRLTTLAYHFCVDSGPGDDPNDLFRDWTGYQDTVSVQALEDFAKEYGYRLRSEDFVDQGFYNHTSRVPSQPYLDWMQFIHRFVVKFGKALVDKAHKAGKMTGIFWGDHWVGVEPYSPEFQRMGVDIHIGAAEDGVALRRVSDAPGPQQKELRLYPYFFPDVFRPGGQPTAESLGNWVKIRRALLRKPIDRIGYGGYLSLALKFPDFVEHVEWLCNDFRTFQLNARGGESWKAPIKVVMLNAWGALRAWINSFGPPQKFLIKRPDVILIAGTNLQECLAGLPVEIRWMSLAEVAKHGLPKDADVVINDGDPDTAWSGGHWWANPKVVAEVRRFVAAGGGFIGCRGPSAHWSGGRFFQLADVLGVEREMGVTVQTAALRPAVEAGHFITADAGGTPDFGVPESFVYARDPKASVLATREGHVMCAANAFGRGRSVFLAGLPFSFANARLLHRAIFWAAGREAELKRWHTSNVLTDTAYYPKSKAWVVVNHDAQPQTTTVYDGQGRSRRVSLKPYESKWLNRA
jgi:1,3-beta-galactosyl-N-acetylhexosamine phosphorylase